jgi:hypothetical protein
MEHCKKIQQKMFLMRWWSMLLFMGSVAHNSSRRWAPQATKGIRAHGYLYYYNIAVLNLNYEPHVSRQKTSEAITAVDLQYKTIICHSSSFI